MNPCLSITETRKVSAPHTASSPPDEQHRPLHELVGRDRGANGAGAIPSEVQP